MLAAINKQIVDYCGNYLKFIYFNISDVMLDGRDLIVTQVSAVFPVDLTDLVLMEAVSVSEGGRGSCVTSRSVMIGVWIMVNVLMEVVFVNKAGMASTAVSMVVVETVVVMESADSLELRVTGVASAEMVGEENCVIRDKKPSVRMR